MIYSTLKIILEKNIDNYHSYPFSGCLVLVFGIPVHSEELSATSKLSLFDVQHFEIWPGKFYIYRSVIISLYTICKIYMVEKQISSVQDTAGSYSARNILKI